MEIVDEKHEQGETNKGFRQCYDEWIFKSQIQYMPAANTSCADTGEDQFFITLACELKCKLYRHEDPVI